MKSLVWILLLCLNIITSSAFTMTTNRVEYIVNAIYKAEGGTNATYQYGVQSVGYKDVTEARQISRNSVVNNYNRWLTSKKHDDKPATFVRFMAQRYCPYNQRVWSKNVLFYWKKFDKDLS